MEGRIRESIGCQVLAEWEQELQDIHKCRVPVFPFSVALLGGSGEEKINTFGVYLF